VNKVNDTASDAGSNFNGVKNIVVNVLNVEWLDTVGIPTLIEDVPTAAVRYDVRLLSDTYTARMVAAFWALATKG
jgi:hypothetical protein